MRRVFVRNDGKPHQSLGCAASELGLKFRGAQRLAERPLSEIFSVCCWSLRSYPRGGGRGSRFPGAAGSVRHEKKVRVEGWWEGATPVLGTGPVQCPRGPSAGLGGPVSPRLAGARSSLTRRSEVPQPHSRVVYERGAGAAELRLRLVAGARPTAPQVQLLGTEGPFKTLGLLYRGFTFL